MFIEMCVLSRRLFIAPFQVHLIPAQQRPSLSDLTFISCCSSDYIVIMFYPLVGFCHYYVPPHPLSYLLVQHCWLPIFSFHNCFIMLYFPVMFCVLVLLLCTVCDFSDRTL